MIVRMRQSGAVFFCFDGKDKFQTESKINTEEWGWTVRKKIRQILKI